MVTSLRIGILALQGDFQKHAEKMHEFGVPTGLIKDPSQLPEFNALILPGGESSTLLKLLSADFKTELKRKIASGVPTFATCAGLILLASRVMNPEQESFALLDVNVNRNAYGSQINSFIVPEMNWSIKTDLKTAEGVFIRAPKISNLGNQVECLIEHEGVPVCVQQGNIVAASFHPELSTGKSSVLEYFLQIASSPYPNEAIL